MKTLENQTQLDNPNNPELVNESISNETRVKCKTEMVMKRGDKLFEYCPYCTTLLTHTWQNVNQDDSNPVRICPKCDIAWIWPIYNSSK